MTGLLQRGAGWKLQRSTERTAQLRVGMLRLVAITPEMLEAECREDAAVLSSLLEAKVTVEWPPVEFDAYVRGIIEKQYAEWPDSFGWNRYVLLERGLGRQRTLVGAVGGFVRAHGDVEIAYSTLPGFQRRGFATAFAGRMVEFLLAQEQVRSVSAQAYSAVPESIKVMERCGMVFAGEGDAVGTVRYRRWRSG